jgi:hypothetical protein
MSAPEGGTRWRPVRRADCPVCGWTVALRPKDGAVMRHHDQSTGTWCQGWIDNRRPEEKT